VGIKEEIMVDKEKYVYKIRYKGMNYILKSFIIKLSDSHSDTATDISNEAMNMMVNIYEQYFFARAGCFFTPHITRPLFLDYTINVNQNMCIEILYEYKGIFLHLMKPITITLTYNLMQQSANILSLLHKLRTTHFNFNPRTMVYNGDDDILSLIDLGSGFGCALRKEVTNVIVNFDWKVKNTALEYAPPEVICRVRGLESKVGLNLYAVDSYHWAMCFYTMLTNREEKDLKNDIERWKLGSNNEYRKFLTFLEIDLRSVRRITYKESKDTIKKILYLELDYEPAKRLPMKRIARVMNKSQRTTNLKYSKFQLEYNKNLELFFTFNKEKIDNIYPKNEQDREVKLSCGHKVIKSHLVSYALEYLLYSEKYNYNCICTMCRKRGNIKSIKLDCGCLWTQFGRKIYPTGYQGKSSYGKCDENKPLTSIDLCLINDYESFKLASMMLSDSPDQWEKFGNLYEHIIKNKSEKKIIWALKNTRMIKKLDIIRYKFEYGGIHVCSALKYNETLERLLLKSNDIKVEGAKEIAIALKYNKTLKVLNVEYNFTMGYQGIKYISEGLKANRTLTDLSLRDGYMGNSGTILISKALMVNKTLKNLCLSYNDIGDEGAISIGEALKVNKMLKDLNVSDNKIGNEGTKAIYKALEINITLRYLRLHNQKITTLEQKTLKEMLNMKVKCYIYF